MTGSGQRKRINATKRADVEFSKHIRGNALGCYMRDYLFECKGALQCAHIISRRYRATRWMLLNARALCAAHHIYFTHHPLEWQEYWAVDGIWDSLRHAALNDPPESAVDALARLKALASIQEDR